MRTAVIDTGGGLRGIYAAGVFDGLIDMGITFDVAIGVSAGSANLASFLSGQSGRNYSFYATYSSRPEYMGVRNFVHGRGYLDLDYVYSTLSNSDGENPLDYPKLMENPTEFVIVATDAETGSPHYFTKDDLSQDNYDIFKASCAIPFACRPYTVGGRAYFDGALSDPLPVHIALEKECDRIVMLLTTPRSVVRTNRVDSFCARRIAGRYPAAARKMTDRADFINAELERLRSLENEGRLLIVAPDDACGVRVLDRRRDRLDQLYEKGRRDASQIRNFRA